MRRFMLISLAALVLSGCSRPDTWDATSTATADVSAARMAKQMTPQELQAFQQALMQITVEPLAGIKDEQAREQERQRLEKSLHGLTAAEILALASRHP